MIYLVNLGLIGSERELFARVGLLTTGRKLGDEAGANPKLATVGLVHRLDCGDRLLVGRRLEQFGHTGDLPRSVKTIEPIIGHQPPPERMVTISTP